MARDEHPGVAAGDGDYLLLEGIGNDERFGEAGGYDLDARDGKKRNDRLDGGGGAADVCLMDRVDRSAGCP